MKKKARITAILLFVFSIFSGLYAQNVNPDSTSIPPIPSEISGAFDLDETGILSFGHYKSYTETTSQGHLHFSALLNNEFSGVQVRSSSGSPGASVGVRIRGNSSVLNDGNPLIILDGQPVTNMEWGAGTSSVDISNRLIDLNPDDIASVKILKGPAATVLYGLRGGNGVIELKTKSGNERPFSGAIRTSIFSERFNKLPERQSQYAQGRPVNGIPTWRGPETGEGFSWGPEISELAFDRDPDYEYDQNGRLIFNGNNGKPAVAYDPYTFFVDGLTHQINGSVTGATEKVYYYFSVGRASSGGFVPKAKFTRNNIAGNINLRLHKRLNLGFSGHVSNSQAYRIQKGANIQGVMLGVLRTTPTFDNGNGKTGWDAVNDPTTYILEDGSQRSYRAGIYDNPYWSVNKNPFEDEVLRMIGNLSVNYEVSDWLSFSSRFGIDNYTDDRHSGFDVNPGRSAGEVQVSDINYSGIHSDVIAHINKQITPNLLLTSQTGFNYFQSQFRDSTTIGFPLLSSSGLVLSNTQTQIGEGTDINRKIAGVFSMVNLNFKNRLLVSVSARNDWSSALPVQTRSFFSYSARAGYILKSPQKDQPRDFLSLLKLNMGFGSVANDAPPHLTQNYFTPAIISGDPYITIDETAGYELSDFLGNDHLKPETTTSFETGMDLGLWNNRFLVNFTWYRAYTKDVISYWNLPASSGFDMIAENGVEISNTGVELDLKIEVFKQRNFAWQLSVNFTRNENLVEKVPELSQDIQLAGFTSTSSRVIEGQPYGAIWGDAFLRNESGQLIIDDEGWPQIAPDKKVLGDPNPDWVMGIGTHLKIAKNLSVSALLDLRQGGDMWCGTCGIMDHFGVSQQSAAERNNFKVFDGVMEDGSPNNIMVGIADPEEGMGSYYRVRYGFGFSEMSIFDTSWIRLRRLAIQYDFGSMLPEKIPISNLSLSIFANNLWLKTDYPGIDPETNLTGTSNGFGIDYFNLPGAKSYGATVKLEF